MSVHVGAFCVACVCRQEVIYSLCHQRLRFRGTSCIHLLIQKVQYKCQPAYVIHLLGIILSVMSWNAYCIRYNSAYSDFVMLYKFYCQSVLSRQLSQEQFRTVVVFDR